MVERKEQEHLLRSAARRQLLRGEIDRRQFMTRSIAAGLGLAGASVVANYGSGSAFAQERPLTPTFYQWIEDLHPSIPQVNEQFPGINYQIAPVEGFGIERFVAEARSQGESTWDVYVGQTPFVEMTCNDRGRRHRAVGQRTFRKTSIDDMIPSIREECTIDGKLYGWPFLLDVIGMSAGTPASPTKAGVAETPPPATWDEYLASGPRSSSTPAPRPSERPSTRTVGARWRRSPHSMNERRLHRARGCSTSPSDAAVEALKLMKKIMEMSHPDILLAGATDGGVNGTPDEVAFAAQRVGYYTKYFNAPLRMAQYWDDPEGARSSHRLPKFADGEGSTVFWTTGLRRCSSTGKNKEKAAEYVSARSPTTCSIWKDSIAGTDTGASGPASTIQVDLRGLGMRTRPDWMPDFVGLVRGQLDRAKAINNHLFGLQQFVIGQPDLGDLPQGRGEGSEASALAEHQGWSKRAELERMKRRLIRRRVVSRLRTRMHGPPVRRAPALHALARLARRYARPRRRHALLTDYRAQPHGAALQRNSRRFGTSTPGSSCCRLCDPFLHRLPGLPHRPGDLDQLHRLQVPHQRAGQTWVGLEQLHRGVQRPLDVGRACGGRRWFTIMFLPGTIIFPLLLAILVDRVGNQRVATFYRVVLLIPAVIPSTLVFVLWKWMYNYQIGPINYFLVEVLGAVHVPERAAVAGGDPAHAALDRDHGDLVGAWLPHVSSSSPASPHPQGAPEAARVDGANEWQVFWHVTLPRLASRS